MVPGLTIYVDDPFSIFIHRIGNDGVTLQSLPLIRGCSRGLMLYDYFDPQWLRKK